MSVQFTKKIESIKLVVKRKYIAIDAYIRKECLKLIACGIILRNKTNKGKLNLRNVSLKIGQYRGWRYGSAVKSSDCSSKGPEFNF